MPCRQKGQLSGGLAREPQPALKVFGQDPPGLQHGFQSHYFGRGDGAGPQEGTAAWLAIPHTSAGTNRGLEPELSNTWIW